MNQKIIQYLNSISGKNSVQLIFTCNKLFLLYNYHIRIRAILYIFANRKHSFF